MYQGVSNVSKDHLTGRLGQHQLIWRYGNSSAYEFTAPNELREKAVASVVRRDEQKNKIIKNIGVVGQKFRKFT